MLETTADSFSATKTFSTDKAEAIHLGARVAFISLGTVMILTGVVGNVLLLVVLCRQFQRKRSIHVLLLANLSLADLLVMGYSFSHFVLDLILRHHPVVNNTHCVANGVLLIMTFTASNFFLVSISLNRYLHVCHSHLYSRVFTLPRTVAWCLLAWLASLLLALLPVLEGSEETSYRYNTVIRLCSFSRKGGFTYVKILVMFGFILPIMFQGFAIWPFFDTGKVSKSTKRKILCSSFGRKNDKRGFLQDGGPVRRTRSLTVLQKLHQKMANTTNAR